MRPVKALVITGFGINCQEETAAAFELAGAKAEIVHLNRLLNGEVSVHDFHVTVFPGGFSFGDDLTAGKALANKCRFRPRPSGSTLLEELGRFVQAGGYVLGICNGFQALVKLGLLPNLGGSFEQEVTLVHNDSARFEDRWVRCRVARDNNSPFLPQQDLVALPVRHGEGKLLVRDEGIAHSILERNLIALRYCLEDGSPTSDYPANPNGSWQQAAGLTDTTGRVLGMMPHPEAFLSLYNHPDWPGTLRRQPAVSQEGDGLSFFRNIVEVLA